LPDRSPLERAQLNYCAPRGIPLSVFQGRVVYPGDPQWLESDWLAALEWQADEAGKCSGCSQSLEDTTGPANFDKWNAEGITCDACRAISRAAYVAAGRDDLDPSAGMRYRVWRDELQEAG